jgi:hypothetical protein
MQRSFRLGVFYFFALMLFQLSSAYVGGRGVTGEPVVFAGERVARDHKPVIEALRAKGITHIRANYWIGYRLAFETKEEVSFSQIGEPLQVRLPEYEQPSAVERQLWPLVLVKGQVPLVSAALRKMGITFSQTQAGEYVILHDLAKSLPEPQQLLLQPTDVLIQASGTQDPWLALDRELSSRWGTGAPQVPGQSFVVEFRKPVTLEAIGYSFGEWWADRPRELKIEIEDTSGNRSVVLSPFEAKGLFELSIRDSAFVFRTKPTPVKKVILTQNTRDAVFDWSIAELSLFGTDGHV